jgi:hypothetical protein
MAREGKRATHRVMTRLFLELAGRLPVLSHCHQAHRERLRPMRCYGLALSVSDARLAGKLQVLSVSGRQAAMLGSARVFVLWTASRGTRSCAS